MGVRGLGPCDRRRPKAGEGEGRPLRGLKGEGGREGARGVFSIFLSFSFSHISYSRFSMHLNSNLDMHACRVYHHMFTSKQTSTHTISHIKFIPK